MRLPRQGSARIKAQVLQLQDHRSDLARQFSSRVGSLLYSTKYCSSANVAFPAKVIDLAGEMQSSIDTENELN